MKYRNSKIDSQSFLFSAKESNEEYYRVAYELTKKLFVGMSKHALAFNSKKYNFYNDRAYPGLIVMAKFFKDIKHKGSKDYYE